MAYSYPCELNAYSSCCGYPLLLGTCERSPKALPVWPHALWLPANLTIRSALPLRQPVHHQENENLIFQMCPESVRINGTDVLSAASRQYFTLMRIFWSQYCKDLSAGHCAENFTLLTRKDIAAQMSGYIEDLDTIRSYIKRAQARINKACKEAFKKDVASDAVIRAAFIEDKGKRGYGLNPYTLHVRPYKNQERSL